MRDLAIKGTIYHKGRMVKGTYSLLRDEMIEPEGRADVEGTLMKGPINFHTHLGDGFIREEPEGDIKKIVGPAGFKIKHLESASLGTVRKAIKQSIDFMKWQGTAAFFDFRESGSGGLNSIPNFSGINGFFLSRPSSLSEARSLLKDSAGFGMSSISDCKTDFIRNLSDVSHKMGKILAIHFSENHRENVDKLASLKPDFIIHCIESSDSDLDHIKKMDIPIVVTPRSNIFHGKRPDYGRFFDKNVKVLLGTDNAFITEPSIMSEAEFLYRYQRSLNRLNPEDVLATVIDNPRDALSRMGLKMDQETYIFYPNQELSAYQLISRPNFYERIVITKKGKRINFFPRTH